jgi:hypothetical protein
LPRSNKLVCFDPDSTKILQNLETDIVLNELLIIFNEFSLKYNVKATIKHLEKPLDNEKNPTRN